MDFNTLGSDVRQFIEEILGYLNFSSGSPDPKFLKNLNELFSRIDKRDSSGVPTWRQLGNLLQDALPAIRESLPAFRSTEQAEAVLALVFDKALPAYRAYHCDLLFHVDEEQLFLPFFIGRMFEAVLRQGPAWNENERIVSGAIAMLNDYIGYRPVAVLRNGQKMQPYEREWVRPVPLYIRSAGVSAGPYSELTALALEILEKTDPEICFEAHFPLEQLDELAFDPRAYDFDHPVNKRPNYLFGQWDMHQLDNAGRSRRFVVQQEALNTMLERLLHHGKMPHQEILFEEAAVLAGTMLMGSGISGSQPQSHDSTVSLAKLVGKIADYRDLFYERLLSSMQGPHARRLAREKATLKQPFG
ncbi:MAG: hypothetical protein ACWGMZ_09320, partial [Thermoguttaceae bacterium]